MIVCVLPVSATSASNVTVYHNGNYATIIGGSGTYWPFNSFPATFEYTEPSGSNPYLRIFGDVVYTGSDAIINFGTHSYIEFIFSVGAGQIDIGYTGNAANIYAGVDINDPSDLPRYRELPSKVDLQLLIDDVLVDHVYLDQTDNDFTVSYNGYVSDYFSLRLDVYEAESINVSGSSNTAYSAYAQFPYPIFTFNGDVSSSEDLSIVIGQIGGVKNEVANLNTKVSEVLDEVKIVSSTVDKMNQTVKDTSDQLKDPDSSIWSAAGSAIGGALEDMFVPSAEDISEVKQGFDELAEDKLGGAYTAMETVEDTFSQLNDKLDNPSSDAGFEFPGISVPLGDDLGTVELLPAQLVVMPAEIKDTFYPICSIIIPIICTIGTFNVLKDMVECFLSGYSYAEYLHRNKGGSDE